MNFKFHRNWEHTVKIAMHKISFCEIWGFWSFFSQAPVRTFTSESFHTTYYIIALEKCEKECSAWSYSSTRFLSIEN